MLKAPLDADARVGFPEVVDDVGGEREAKGEVEELHVFASRQQVFDRGPGNQPCAENVQQPEESGGVCICVRLSLM